jgi:hypothetical protein
MISGGAVLVDGVAMDHAAGGMEAVADGSPDRRASKAAKGLSLDPRVSREIGSRLRQGLLRIPAHFG